MNCIRKLIKIIKLTIIYFRRILFAKNHFKVSFFTKLRANLTRGFTADQWALYDFNHNDHNEYLSEFDWYRSRYINEPFDYVCNNKIVTNEILKHYARVPHTYMIKNRGVLSSFDYDRVNYEMVIPILKEKQTLFFKPYGAGKGTGVCNFIYENDKFYIDKKECNESDIISFIKSKDNWMISETMKQHKYLNDIYDKTVNTIRIITLRDIETHDFKVFFAVQRIGTFKTIPVDNGSRGGLVSKIDLETGILSEARCLHDHNVYEVHPDSKAPIKGVVVPNWEKLKKEVVYLANKMPYMHFIAWDVLVIDEGICIIEANTSSGVNIIQLWGGQRNGELGDFYRHYGIIK